MNNKPTCTEEQLQHKQEVMDIVSNYEQTDLVELIGELVTSSVVMTNIIREIVTR